MSMNIENQIFESGMKSRETGMESNEELVRKIQTGENSRENMALLWQQNQKFITKIARRYSTFGEMEDLEQEGYIGLHEAVKHYELSSEVPFINYAAFWIRQVMRRYIDNCGRAVRIPTHAVDKIQRYKKIKSEYQKHYGKLPTDREMCAFMEMGEESLKGIKKVAAMGQMRSLDEPIENEGENLFLRDTIASKENMEESVIDRIETDKRNQELWAAVDSLPDPQGKVLWYRFVEKNTYQQIGDRMGMTFNAVRREYDKGMRLLRHPERNKGFIGYREQFIRAASIHHVGVRCFRNTWTSEVERDAMRL